MNLMHIARTGAAVLVIAGLAAAPAFAQGGRRGMGMPRYDKATERTVSGTVEEVQMQQGRGAGMGVHLLFKTDAGRLEVHVGPSAWLADKKYTFAAGDALTITGSAVKVAGADAFIAREIVKGGETFTLRNDAGRPLWSGAGSRTK